MAVTFTLSDGTTTIDLTDTSVNIALQEHLYVPVVATPTGDGSIPPYVTETLPVSLNAASYDGYATLMQNVAALQKRAAEYWVNPQQATPVWLTCKLDGETTGRRALVRRIDWEWRNDNWQEWLYQECGTTTPPTYLFGTILVERHPYWERLTPRTFPNDTGATGVVKVYDYTAAGDELLGNTGFEAAGAGDPDFFQYWTETAGDGAIADEGVVVNAGSHACKMTSGVTSNTCVAQLQGVATYGAYTLSFYARGDGTHAGRYSVYDSDNAAYIIAVTSTGVTAAAYNQVTATFTVPAGCDRVTVTLWCCASNGDNTYFDDVSLTLTAHDIVGDVGARIERLRMEPAGSDTLGRIWIGVRSAQNHGTLGNFVPTWECEDGNLNDGVGGESGITLDAVSDVNGASPGGGSGVYVEVTESDLDWDDTWHEALRLDLADVAGANEADNLGLFLWLLRAEVTAGTWEVQLRYGTEQMADDDYVKGNIVAIDDASWNIFTTDVQQIPLHDPRTFTAQSADMGFAVQIWAQRTDGAGDLHLDSLYPIPIEEGFAFLEGFSSDEPIEVYTGPRDETAAAVTPAAALYDLPAISAYGLYLPPGDGRLIIAYARASSSDFTDALLYLNRHANEYDTGTYYERWTALRGAE